MGALAGLPFLLASPALGQGLDLQESLAFRMPLAPPTAATCGVLSIPRNSPQWQGPGKPSSLVPTSLVSPECRHSKVDEGLGFVRTFHLCISEASVQTHLFMGCWPFDCWPLASASGSSLVLCFRICLTPSSLLSGAGHKSLILVESNLVMFDPMVCAFLVLVGKAFPAPPPNQKPKIPQFSSISCRVLTLCL